MEIAQTDRGFTYELPNVDGGSQTLQFIRKKEDSEQPGKLVTMINGVTNEVVILAVIDRVKFLDDKKHSDFNIEAVQHLEAALVALQNRTVDREARGVEGTTAD